MRNSLRMVLLLVVSISVAAQQASTPAKPKTATAAKPHVTAAAPSPRDEFAE